jgi:CPA2 family monovalent cation:H+ antiporter-2
MTGQYLAKAARRGNIPYTIIEMNPETVKREQHKGEPILFGDASSPLILEEAGLETARVAVVAISDILATRTVTQTIREMRKDIYVIVRTRFYNEVNEIYAMGADLVIPEEFETSVEIFTRVLTKYLIPQEEIEKFTQEVRTSGYQMLRTPMSAPSTLCDVMAYLPGLEIKTIVLGRRSPFIQQTLGDINLRKNHGVTVLAVRRGQEMISGPGSGTVLHADDHLIVIGPPERARALVAIAAPGA